MDIIGTKVRLSIDEPWDSDIDIIGRIIQSFILNERPYYVIEDEPTQDKFVVTARFAGYPVTEILSGKIISVGVGVPINPDFSFDEPISLSDLSYQWIGSIKIISNK